MSFAKKTALHLVLKSLKEEPEIWEFGNYEAKNGKIVVWMKNRFYATHFSYGSIEVGGQSFFWALNPWEWWRVRLINAVEQAQIELEMRNQNV